MGSEMLDKVGELLKMFPFIRCPRCGLRDETGTGSPTFFEMHMKARVPVYLNEGTKTVEADDKDIEYGYPTIPSKVVLTCHNCQHDFNLPADWKIDIRRRS